ncbi:AI-2E family transporter [Noviherbaspirillum massiliense]|uniref:AI-2E family transporter n=1 Tax=Noviherbaspirillum massiliense TaxID=1465823 RepID=UPI0002D598B6|nr:AI-2E family transporter [Noviherbaspirillum massiliense]
MLGIDPRTARIVWTVLLIFLLLYLTYLMRTTLLVLVFSVFFSYLLYPLVYLAERFKPRHMPRIAAVAAVFIIVIGFLAAAGIVFGPRIADEAVRLGQQLPDLLKPANLSKHIPLPAFIEPIWARLLDVLHGRVQADTRATLPLLQRAGEGIVHTLGNLIYVAIIPILSFILISEAPTLKAQLLPWFGKRRGLWRDIAEDLHLLFAGYVRAWFLLALAAFVSYSIALSMLGVPYPFFFAGASAVLEFIPVFGPLVSIGAVLGVSTISGYPHLLWLVVFFLLYRIFQDYMLNPYLMTGEAKVSPLLVVVGLLAGEQIAGTAGIFLSVPVLAALKIILTRTGVLARAGAKG